MQRELTWVNGETSVCQKHVVPPFIALRGLDVTLLRSLIAGRITRWALHVSLVPEQEAQNFDTHVTAFRSHLIQRDVTSPLFFQPDKLGGLGVGSAVQRHAAAPWRAWQSVILTLMATTKSPDTDTLFNTAPRLRAQLVQLQTTLSLQMNKPAFLLKPLGAGLRHKATQKKRVTTIQRHFHKQLYDSLTTTTVDRVVLLSESTSHTGANLMQPGSEAYEVEDRCFRVAIARKLMLSHPAAPNAADDAQSCPNKSAAGLGCSKPVDLQQHHCHGGRYGVDRRHAAVARCTHSGTKVFIEQEVPAVNGQREHARMDLVFNLNGSVTYLDVSIVPPSLQPVPCCHNQHLPKTHGQES